MSDSPIVEIILGMLAVVGIFVLVLVSIFVLMMVFGKKLEQTDEGFWEEYIAYAFKSKASKFLVEIGKSPQIKVDDQWQPIKGIIVEEGGLRNLKSVFQQPSDVWEIHGIGVVQVVRNEKHVIELELKSE